MNKTQRRLYFGLWKTVCRVQGWDEKDEHQRQRITFAATGETSTTGLDEDQITLLFTKLRWLADPQSFDKALADSDPSAALAANKRKQVIWRITESAAKVPGDPEAWLADIAADRHGTRDWRKLPDAQLLRFAMTVSGRTTAKAREQRAAKCKKGRATRLVQAACTADAAPQKGPQVFTAHPDGQIFTGSHAENPAPRR
jgi:hypothetical protein